MSARRAHRPDFFRRPAAGLCLAVILLGQLAAAAAPKKSWPELPGGVGPVPVRYSSPAYPEEMRRSGLTGRVTVDFIVDTGGRVQNPYVVASNNPWFERPALDAILKWTFKPGLRNGRPVNVRARQVLEFATDNRSANAGLWLPPKPKDLESLPPEYHWSTPPLPVNTAFPVYPFPALQANLRGKVRIQFVISPAGQVVSSAVRQAASPELGLAMLAMIETWTFTPAARKDGTPCFAVIAIEQDFQPDGRGDAPVSRSARKILDWLKKSPEKVVSFADLDHEPKPLSRRPPVYPLALLAAGTAGEAVVEFFIDEQGDVQLPAIVSSSAPEFGYAAVQAIATWRFERPLKAGKAAVVRARIPLAFAAR
jgi:TonB family protein